jgi:hypothetical protein
VHGDRVCRRLVRDGSPSRVLMLTAATVGAGLSISRLVDRLSA